MTTTPIYLDPQDDGSFRDAAGRSWFHTTRLLTCVICGYQITNNEFMKCPDADETAHVSCTVWQAAPPAPTHERSACMWCDAPAASIEAGEYGEQVGPKCTRHARPAVDEGSAGVHMGESATCAGCGRTFKSARGLRAHQSQKHNTAACKPITTDWRQDV